MNVIGYFDAHHFKVEYSCVKHLFLYYLELFNIKARAKKPEFQYQIIIVELSMLHPIWFYVTLCLHDCFIFIENYLPSRI